MVGKRGELGILSAVLFDLDDTLLDSFDARVGALERVFKRTGITCLTAEQFLRDLQGAQIKEAFNQLEVAQGVGADLFENYRRAYWVKEPGLLSLYPGVKPMLEKLYARGVKLGVVTQKGREFEVDGEKVGALYEVVEVGIASLLSVLVGFEDVSSTKPHPEGINLALKRLGVYPHETLVVGDSIADIEAASAAGCWSCYAIWGIPAAGRRLDSIQADVVAEMPEALLRLTFI